jgi:hypothetical protein
MYSGYKESVKYIRGVPDGGYYAYRYAVIVYRRNE